MKPIRFLLALVLTGLPAAALAQTAGYEVWVANQGLDKIQILDGETLAVVAEIDADNDGKPATSKPHMVLFSPDYKYAYVANVGSAPKTNNILVIRTSDRAVVATIPSGPSTHAVTPSPDGKRAVAASVGSDTLFEIVVDAPKESFQLGREIPVGDGPGGEKDRPICAFFTADSKKIFVTNGGDLAAVDPLSTGSVSILDAGTGKEIKRHPGVGQEACGLALSNDGKKMYINVGGYVNTYMVFDTKSNRLLKEGNTAGYDSHGMRITPDGKELWIANRLSNNIVIVDTATDRVIARLPEVGDRPDLIDVSPDGKFAFITLRGQAVTKTIHDVTGKEPGLAVLDIKERKRIKQIPLEGDPHGIAVRPK